jgi:hypothetical protein
MKKLAILFLLISLAFSAFAVEGVGDITAGLSVEAQNINVDEAKGIAITPSLSFSRELIPALKLTVGLHSNLHGIWDGDTTIGIPLAENVTGVGIDLNKLDVRFDYSLAAGPGELGLFLRNRININVKNYTIKVAGFEFTEDAKGLKEAVRVGVSYSLPAGPGSLGIGAYTGFSYADKTKYGRAEAFAYDDLGFDLGYSGIAAGPGSLSIETSTWFNFGKNNGDEFQLGGTWWNIGFGADAFGAGVEGGLSYNYVGTDFDSLGVTFKPYFEYYELYQGLTVGVYLKVGKGTAHPGSGGFGGPEDDVAVSPGLYAIYTF